MLRTEEQSAAAFADSRLETLRSFSNNEASCARNDQVLNGNCTLTEAMKYF
jgi:hypothetical protein